MIALAVLSGCLLSCATAAIGQDVTEASLKAAFIHNFVKFTEWPRDVLPPARHWWRACSATRHSATS